MKYSILIFVLFFVACSSENPLGPTSPSSLTGEWEMSVTTDTGMIKTIFTVVQSDTMLVGQLVLDPTDTIACSGWITGGKMYFGGTNITKDRLIIDHLLVAVYDANMMNLVGIWHRQRHTTYHPDDPLNFTAKKIG